ncbi:pro-Pol polyprotein [Trichonephila clavipes]|nr:pro-Pol polyprotein [Trichonephila clavipes]
MRIVLMQVPKMDNHLLMTVLWSGTSAIGHVNKTHHKRIVLQSAGKIYDPVGFLSPYTIRLKCLLQELWLRKLSWDDELPPDIHAVWSQWCQKAYGAAAFLRVKHKDRVSVDLVTSKSRVAPLKRLSLPRFLGTDGALCLLHASKGSQENPRSEVFNQSLFFSGRTLRSPYIGSKVQAIDGNPLLRTGFGKSNPSPILTRGFHCSGKDNPADLLTRGISVGAFTTNSKWWNGSSFLRQIDFRPKD